MVKELTRQERTKNKNLNRWWIMNLVFNQTMSFSNYSLNEFIINRTELALLDYHTKKVWQRWYSMDCNTKGPILHPSSSLLYLPNITKKKWNSETKKLGNIIAVRYYYEKGFVFGSVENRKGLLVLHCRRLRDI